MNAHEHLWFLDTLVTPRVPSADGNDAVSVLESRARHGDSPPLHVHGEDEIFHVLDGKMLVRVDGADHELGPGDMFVAPSGLPHSYRVESDEARWLVITAGGKFEQFVRAFSRPAEQAELPPASPPPSPTEIESLAKACRQFDIELVGPPIH